MAEAKEAAAAAVDPVVVHHTCTIKFALKNPRALSETLLEVGHCFFLQQHWRLSVRREGGRLWVLIAPTPVAERYVKLNMRIDIVNSEWELVKKFEECDHWWQQGNSCRMGSWKIFNNVVGAWDDDRWITAARLTITSSMKSALAIACSIGS